MRARNLKTMLVALLLTAAVLLQPAAAGPLTLNKATFTEALACATRTSTVNGTAVNLVDYTGYVALSLMSEAASAGTNPTLNVKVQDSSDGSTGWADVSGATWTEVTDAADAYETILINSDEVKQYIRIVGTIGGTTTPTFAFGVSMASFKDNN